LPAESALQGYGIARPMPVEDFPASVAGYGGRAARAGV